MLDTETRSQRGRRESGAAPVVFLRGEDVSALIDPAACLSAVEAAFQSQASGNATVPMPMHIPAHEGGFHVKGAAIVLDRLYVAVKVNGNFPQNPVRAGLPAIQGAVLLYDGLDGSLLAILDSIEITRLRTAAASALAARYLARPDADAIAICGCGVQGLAHLVALAQVAHFRQVRAWDIDVARAHSFASEMRSALGLDVQAVEQVRDATLHSHIVVTTTSSQVPFLSRECVSPGTFVAAVGADNPSKNEIAGQLLPDCKVVVDSLEQCAVMGDLHHALESGLLGRGDVHAELGELVVGRKPGRTCAEEITVFDSTGLAIEDAAVAAQAYRRAVEHNVGMSIQLSRS